MSRIFYIMGKSASGKDKIYGRLAANENLALKKIVLYTTRPIREKETDGVHYHFVDEKTLADFARRGKVIERRDYRTVAGIWSYATVDDGAVRLERKMPADKNGTESGDRGENYIAIGTLESYRKIRDYYGKEVVCPIYIEVEDGERLARALKREKKQAAPNYEELCRRFLADSRDFSEENIRKTGISRRFDNTGELEVCLKEVEEMILGMI